WHHLEHKLVLIQWNTHSNGASQSMLRQSYRSKSLSTITPSRENALEFRTISICPVCGTTTTGILGLADAISGPYAAALKSSSVSPIMTTVGLSIPATVGSQGLGRARDVNNAWL